jgi:hypothetical protein
MAFKLLERAPPRESCAGPRLNFCVGAEATAEPQSSMPISPAILGRRAAPSRRHQPPPQAREGAARAASCRLRTTGGGETIEDAGTGRLGQRPPAGARTFVDVCNPQIVDSPIRPGVERVAGNVLLCAPVAARTSAQTSSGENTSMSPLRPSGGFSTSRTGFATRMPGHIGDRFPRKRLLPKQKPRDSGAS